MLGKLNLSNPKIQYFLGVMMNITFLVILYSFGTSYKNLQIPSGVYQDNIWKGSDVMTYVRPAMNFIEHGVFGQNKSPDHFRTIGYPAIISLFYSVFGKYWLLALQIFQSIIFAFIYPIISSTIKILLPKSNRKLIVAVFLFLCLSGAYFTRCALVLTDTLFTLLFVLSFYYGLKVYITKKYYNLILYLVFISLAALVRPTLSMMPLLNLSMAYFVAKAYKYQMKFTMVKSCLISVGILCLVNISTLRNYINYSFFSPSSVIGLNAFEYLSKKVLITEGKTEQYILYKKQIEAIPNVSLKDKMYKSIMFKTVEQYPFSTCKVLIINTVNVSLSNNLVSNISNYFGYEWKAFKGSNYPYKISKDLFILTYLFMLFYAILWSMFFIQLVIFFVEKDYKMLLVISTLIFMFILPAILTGDGGGRFRIAVEHILFIFGFTGIFNVKEYYNRLKFRV